MAGPLLETKLHVPRLRRGLVARPELHRRLARGTESALTLVSAPAGFGKTTLLTEWLATSAEGQFALAWLSLDERDNDPVVFWRYFVAALRKAAPGVCESTLALLDSGRPDADAIVSSLIGDLDAVTADLMLVLDDYHVIGSLDIQQAMAFLLDHLPATVHLVMATRADPALPLARLRGRGQLVEIRVADLRFTSREAAAYLNEVMDLDLTAANVATLEQQTEGWIAALQLAALSLRGRDDPGEFIAHFAGDDHYIVDYLVEEVLQRQTDDVRTFLLQTSVLNRLHASLCDAVTGREDGRAMLEALDRSNLFLIPLDDRRHWYRYHHLFADVLRARLLDQHPEQAAVLHQRASQWHAHNGGRPEAIEHALEAEDFDSAADLVELALPALRQSRHEATLHRWLRALPEHLFVNRPVLSVGYAGSLMVLGEINGVEERLRDAERLLDPPARPPGARRSPEPEMRIVDHDQFRGLPSNIAIYRAGQALAVGDVAATVDHAQRALDIAGPDDHFERGASASLLGLAHWHAGDLSAAYRWYSQGMASLDRAGHSADVVGGAVSMADIRIAQGRLVEAMRLYEQGLRRATEQPGPPLRGGADMHVGISQLLLERNEPDAAHEHLLAGEALGEHAGMPRYRGRWHVAMARLHAMRGDLSGAIELLDEAERCYVADYAPPVCPIPAVRARVKITQGRLGAAAGWASEQGLSADDELSYLREYEHITFVRLLLARHAAEGGGWLQDAMRLLGRLLAAAEEAGRTGSVIEILVLQALAHQADGDVPVAVECLHRAVALAAPEGYLRVFADEGPRLAELLKALGKQGVAPAYVDRLLAALGGSAPDVRPGQPLVDPLSERELEVLRLLASDLSGPEIARELVVSLNTVRTHTKNIYTKLGVNNRRAAVRQATELQLLTRSG